MKWRAAVDAAVAPLGLTHAKYSVLASLRGMTRSGARPSQRALADHTGLDPIYISKLAHALERAELIERLPDAADARAVRLTMTPKGVDVAEQAIVIVGDLLERLTAPLGGTRSRRVQVVVRDLELLIAADVPISSRTNP
jgi:DNA-binding MarR family transcriptional regulator